MTKPLTKWLRNLFRTKEDQSELDRYILSKHPTSIAEVENWILTYDRLRRREGLWT